MKKLKELKLQVCNSISDRQVKQYGFSCLFFNGCHGI